MSQESQASHLQKCYAHQMLFKGLTACDTVSVQPHLEKDCLLELVVATGLSV